MKFFNILRSMIFFEEPLEKVLFFQNITQPRLIFTFPNETSKYNGLSSGSDIFSCDCDVALDTNKKQRNVSNKGNMQDCSGKPNFLKLCHIVIYYLGLVFSKMDFCSYFMVRISNLNFRRANQKQKERISW